MFEFEMNNAEKCEKYRKRKKLKEKDREMTLGIYQEKYKELKNKYKELRHNYKLFKLYHGKCQYDQSNEEMRHLLERKLFNHKREDKEATLTTKRLQLQIIIIIVLLVINLILSVLGLVVP